MYDYQMYADAAKERLTGSIGQNVCHLIEGLLKQSEYFPGWEDELCQLSSIEEVGEHEYRMLADDEDELVRIVPVKSIDQDDEDVEPLTVVSESVFAKWVFAKHYPDEQEDVPPCDFESKDDRDALFEVAQVFLGEPSDLTQFLQDVDLKWENHYNLLDEGDEAPTECVEIYEYWLVDRQAKTELESVGERVVEILDLYIWCRTTTGQAFWYDGCMQALGKKYLVQ